MPSPARLRAAALAALFLLSPRTAIAQAEDVLADAKKRLAELGYPVPDGMKSETRDEDQVIADLDGHQDLLMPADSFAVQHALFTGLGVPAGRDADDLRRQALASMASGMSAYYDPAREVFVLLPSRTREMVEAFAGSLLPLVTHELVHAHQDARDGGLAGWFGGADRTIDSSMARRIAMEGEAELAALVALEGELGLDRLDGNGSIELLEGVLAGELIGRIYEAGRQLALDRHRAGGFDAVRELWERPPPSTEQALHPIKYGRDAPTPVRVPAMEGLEVGRSTVIGELLVFNALRQCGVDRLDAAVAAAGWDGDRFVAFDRGEERDVALVWRSVWDREEDAADFADRLEPLGRGEVVRVGRVVDWIHAEDRDLLAALTAVCEADRAQPRADDDDVASTARVEEQLREQHESSSVEGELWRHEDVGLAVPVPAGWEVREINGMKMLVDPAAAEAGFALNVNVVILPRGPLADLDAAIDVNRQQLELLNLNVARLEVAERGETAVLLGEYSGKIGQLPPLHFLMLLYLRGDQQVVVTLTATEEQWAERAEELQRILDDVRVEGR